MIVDLIYYVSPSMVLPNGKENCVLYMACLVSLYMFYTMRYMDY